jgi:tryptophan halogenase
VLIGQEVEAGGYHPAADLLSDAETLTRLRHIRQVIADTAEQLPTQRAFLAANNSSSDVSLRRAS